MENNGQDCELNSLALDPVSPASNTSKDMLDEPAAPRRNSTDDNDPTRPRKRLAAMAAVSPEQKEAAAAEAAISNDKAKNREQYMNGTASSDPPHQDGEPKEPPAYDGASEGITQDEDGRGGTPPLITGTGNKITIHLRTRGLSEGEDANANSADPDTTNNEPPFPPRSLEGSASPDSLQGDSPSGSPRSPEVEVEEIEEMDEDDHLSTHVTIVEEYTHHPVTLGDPVKVKEVMDACAVKLERDPCPIRSLDEISSSISNLLNSAGNHLEGFIKSYGNNREIWLNLPPIMETLLKRSEPFGNNFVRDGVHHGIHSIIRVVQEFAKLTALFVKYDVWNMERTHVEVEVLPLSRAYQRILLMCFKMNSLYALIDRTYRWSMVQVFPQLMAAFQESYQGFKSLKRFEELVLERTQYQPKLLVYACFPLEIFLRYYRALEPANIHGIMDDDNSMLKEEVMRVTLELLQSVEERLAMLLDSHVQLLTNKEYTAILENFCQLSHWLYSIHGHEPDLAALMEERLQGRYRNIDPNELPALAEWTARFPFLLKLLKSNRMDFRLHGLIRATGSLVKTWREHNGQDWQETTILRYLADYILENRVVEYLMGPESHHELIRRSANIAGFLIVTSSITPEITSALWQPIADAKDPRIVQAALSMLQDLITNMPVPMHLELSERISQMPFSSFDTYMIEFVGRLLDAIRNNFFATQSNINAFRLGLAPFEMLIKIIRSASHEEEKTVQVGTVSPSAIFDFADKELIALAECGPESNLRRKIFLDCVGDIREMNASSTGSITVIKAFLQKRPHIQRADSPTFSEDLEYLVKELDLPGLLIKEIAFFVDTHRNYEFFPRLRKLKCRLDLLQFILHDLPGCLSRDSGETLWSYLVGDKALGAVGRDNGFDFYCLFAPHGANPLLDDAFRTYFPALSPKYFCRSTWKFCQKSIEYLNQPGVVKAEEAIVDGVVNIAGVEQLWKVILKAPDEALASQATAYFVSLYLDSPDVIRNTPKVVEATHFKLVQRCIELLKSAAPILNRSGNQDSARDEMATEVSEELFSEQAIEYSRALDLLDQLVSGHKIRPRYNIVQKQRAAEIENINGAPLTVKARWHNLNLPTAPTTFRVGNLDTGQEFHNRLSRAVGIDKFRVILLGREIRFLDDPLKTLHDFGFVNESNLLIAISPDPNASATTTASSSCVLTNLNTLQVEVMRHFDDLYSLLSLPELQASKIWLFLRKFPVHDRIKAKIVSEESWLEIFPIDKPYKIFYSLYALRAWFMERRQENLDETSGAVIDKAIGWLLEAIMHSADKTDIPYSSNTRINMIHELLGCLRTFLEDSAMQSSFPDAEGFIARLFDILQTCARPEHAPYSAYCTISAFNVLVEASRIDSTIWSFVTQRNDLRDLIQRFLLEDERTEVREGTKDAIMNLCNRQARNGISPKQCAEFFWPILKDIISLDNLKPDLSAELFEASFSVFDVLGKTGSDILDLKAYFRDWSDRLVRYRVVEFVGRPREDFVITGYARLLELCLGIANRRKIAIKTNAEAPIFENLLFPPPSSEMQNGELVERFPCLHGPTRTVIYNLILQLAVDHSSLSQLVRLNAKLFQEDRPLFEGFHADRSRWARSLAGHVGLQNMSNTCYLNSLLTQLFMNRPFRQFILNIPVGESEERHRLLYYMKVLFARMQNSYTKAIEPREFVEAISDYEGEQIDITVQMDVDEFFNLIFDRLESQMPTKELKTAFRAYYGGHLVQQVKSKECPHISEREEPFSAIQCDIKGKTSLQESLKAYVEGEAMEGDNKYSCTSCDRLVNAVKRTCLKDIPDHLILHLKRFEFDLQTMHRSKINDSFEFPTILDMKPYTVEHLSRGDDSSDSCTADLFELVGVLVHSGTAESGHYYSYIRNRLSPSNTPEWLEFNDSEVNSFDPSTIPNACYGGVDGRDNISQQFVGNKPYSAYMLFYERSSKLAGKSNEVPTNLKLPLPGNLEIEVQRENEIFLRKYCMFDNNHIAFVRNLLEHQLHLSKHQQGPCTTKEKEAFYLGLDTLEQIASRFKDSTECEALFTVLNAYCVEWVECCQVFGDWLIDREDPMTNLLVCNPYMKVRQQFSHLIKIVLNQVRRKRTMYPRNSEEHQEEDWYDDATLNRICESLANAWDGLQWSTKAWNDFFALIAAIAAIGPNERRCLVRFEFLRKVLELLLADHVNPPKKQEYVFENFIKIWNKPRRPPLNNLGDALACLMKACDPNLKPSEDHYSRFHHGPMPKLPMSFQERNLFTFCNGKNVMMSLNKLLENKAAVDSLGTLISEIISADDVDPDLQDKIMITLLSGVPVDPAHEAQPFLRCLLYFIRATKSQKHIRDIIDRVAGEVQTIGTDGGMEHLAFLRDCVNLRNKNMKVGCLRWRLLECIGDWAPPLLVYCDATVRDETESFVEELLLQPFADSPNTQPKLQRAMGDLTQGCFQFVESRLPRQRQQCDEKTFENVLRLLDHCRVYQEDDDSYRLRIENLRAVIEKLVSEEEEDAELGTDDWGGSEIPSDTQELQMEDYSN